MADKKKGRGVPVVYSAEKKQYFCLGAWRDNVAQCIKAFDRQPQAKVREWCKAALAKSKG